MRCVNYTQRDAGKLHYCDFQMDVLNGFEEFVVARLESQLNHDNLKLCTSRCLEFS